MFEPDETGVIATVHASPPRRLFACVVLFVLGATLIYTALAQPPALHWLVFLLGFGGLSLWLGERLWRATQLGIVLTETELRDTSGAVLARLDEIRHVDRGALAMKPANGFTLVLAKARPRGWAPGLWWRVGRRLGVGGVTAAGQTKFMAEQIAQRIKDHNR